MNKNAFFSNLSLFIKSWTIFKQKKSPAFSGLYTEAQEESYFNTVRIKDLTKFYMTDFFSGNFHSTINAIYNENITGVKKVFISLTRRELVHSKR